jgi:hypothetical protein
LHQIHQILLRCSAQHGDAVEYVTQSVERLRGHLRELEDKVVYLVKTHPESGKDQKLSLPRWLRAEGQIASIRSNIIDARSNLSLAINGLL